MVSSIHMTLETTKDLFYLVLSIVILGAGVFICWAFYEIARMLHQANQLVTETREKINRVEHGIIAIKEKLESSVGYLGMLAEGGKSLLSFLHTSEEKKEKRRSKKAKNEDEDEE